MGSKTSFLVLALAFAVVVLIVSEEVAAARDLASNHEGKVDDFFGPIVKGAGGVIKGGTAPAIFHCTFGCCGGFSLECHCCSTYAEATAYKQAHN
ncbi:hypothetical protein SSX86_031362 [Deinandra increscens subsp. villosa]|uniref:Uncharacterized protein n=1 Tax=Deinandra increscens subsp. villosa TaxID=3103831 RepID=A0AAP0C470_9ASTR